MKTTQNLMRVKELLLTPPTFSDNKARLQTNLDTDFLKLIAIVSMLIDHIGSVFFPEVRVLRWIGRLAFPIFCYCMTVGLLYTHDIFIPFGNICTDFSTLLYLCLSSV